MPVPHRNDHAAANRHGRPSSPTRSAYPILVAATLVTLAVVSGTLTVAAGRADGTDPPAVRCVLHRADHRTHDDNTIRAVREAVAADRDVELDAQPTAPDDQGKVKIPMYHDLNLASATDMTGIVGDLPADQVALARYDEFGGRIAWDWELTKASSGVDAFVEVKFPLRWTDEVMDLWAKHLVKTGAGERTYLYTLSRPLLARVSLNHPEIQIGLELNSNTTDTAAEIAAMGVSVVMLAADQATPEYVAGLHAEGLRVVARMYPIGHRGSAIAAGVDAVMVEGARPHLCPH